jgi:hypothetical protein
MSKPNSSPLAHRKEKLKLTEQRLNIYRTNREGILKDIESLKQMVLGFDVDIRETEIEIALQRKIINEWNS